MNAVYKAANGRRRLVGTVHTTDIAVALKYNCKRGDWNCFAATSVRGVPAGAVTTTTDSMV